MSKKDQHLVDHLFEQIFLQKLRCAHFDIIHPQPSPNSVWNKSSDEKVILELMIKKYKKFYINKAEEIKEKLKKIKENNLNSYLTYDTEYYINEFNDRIEEVNKYLVEIETKNIDQISKDDLSFISKDIEILFPDFIPKPNLLGLLNF